MRTIEEIKRTDKEGERVKEKDEEEEEDMEEDIFT